MVEHVARIKSEIARNVYVSVKLKETSCVTTIIIGILLHVDVKMANI